jgi:Zn-dependent peptidase ImmA (M78 family)
MDDFLNERFDELVEAYSQIRYDFDPEALSKSEISKIKTLAREKRVDFGIAPIGKNIFDYIMSKEKNLYFETQPFENKDLDALIFMPSRTSDIAFIILNTNQPLLNQIFATAHEYYHYLTDLEMIKKNPHVCSLSHLKDKMEQKASRFAAEFLLPEEALRIEVDDFLTLYNVNELDKVDFADIAILCYKLTIRYCLPLKAVIIRLYEERLIGPQKFSHMITNYRFIKDTFITANTRASRQIKELVSTDNPYLPEILYDLIPIAFNHGFVSLDKIEKDIQLLGLKKESFNLDFEEDLEAEDDLDLLELREQLKFKLLDKE